MKNVPSKVAAQVAEDKTWERVSDRPVNMTLRLRRRAYLSNKGIDPNGPFQLDLLFPKTINDSQRILPNDYARSAIFTVRNKREQRRALKREKVYHLHEQVSILFTGIELRADDDELVWMQIMHYAKTCPFGHLVEFSIKDLVADIGWPKNGFYYDRARDCISRLNACEVTVSNESAYGTSPVFSMLGKYVTVNDGDGKPTFYQCALDHDMILLFAGNTFTNHTWDTYRKFGTIARRLADYVESHRHPYPLDVQKFQSMCGSEMKSLPGWRRMVRNACAELESAGLAKIVKLNDDDKICVAR